MEAVLGAITGPVSDESLKKEAGVSVFLPSGGFMKTHIVVLRAPSDMMSFCALPLDRRPCD